MLVHVERLLRSERAYRPGRGPVPWWSLIGIVTLASFLYGVAMGSFGGRPLQMLYSGLKVPLLLAVATVVCVPSFLAVHILLGLRDDFFAACRAVLAAQATLAVALCSLAPVTLVWYLVIDRYPMPNLVNAAHFALATGAGHLMFRRHYAHLLAKEARHRIPRTFWLALYIFVAIQMAWTLRPFIGDPDLPTQFFRDDAWTNAYVAVSRLLGRLLGLW